MTRWRPRRPGRATTTPEDGLAVPSSIYTNTLHQHTQPGGSSCTHAPMDAASPRKENPALDTRITETAAATWAYHDNTERARETGRRCLLPSTPTCYITHMTYSGGKHTHRRPWTTRRDKELALVYTLEAAGIDALCGGEHRGWPHELAVTSTWT